jgi:hypothetical protein
VTHETTITYTCKEGLQGSVFVAEHWSVSPLPRWCCMLALAKGDSTHLGPGNRVCVGFERPDLSCLGPGLVHNEQQRPADEVPWVRQVDTSSFISSASSEMQLPAAKITCHN